MALGRLITQMQPPSWAESAVGFAASVLAAALIAVQLERLHLYHFDQLSLLFVVLGHPLNAMLTYTRLPSDAPGSVGLSPS